MTGKKVYCVATEYVNPGPRAGGGGFDWWHTAEEADKAYAFEASVAGDDFAVFRFDYTLLAAAEPSSGQITEAIDAELEELCAKAVQRKVGCNVLRYWKDNNLNMGDATTPATEATMG
jgi:hypothetical protein